MSRWRNLAASLGVALLPLTALWAVLLAPRAPGPTRADAGLAAARMRLDGFLTRQDRQVEALAARFADWEVVPPAAARAAFRAAAAASPDLRVLFLADPAGRIQAAWDADRPVGQESQPVGSLDPVVARRDLLRSEAPVWRAARSQAGRVERLELGVPLRTTAGQVRGYVGASVDLAALRADLGALARGSGVALSIRDRSGDLVYPCGRPPRDPASTRVAAGFTLAATPRARGGRPLGLGGVVTLLALGLAILLGARARRLDSRADLAMMGGDPPDEGSSAPGP
jgi:hypothetical protein